MVTEYGIRKAYYRTFLSHAKAAIIDGSDFWETDPHIHLPECMLKGSHKEALQLTQFDSHFEYLMTRRIENVQNHLSVHVNCNYLGPRSGERVVVEEPRLADMTRRKMFE